VQRISGEDELVKRLAEPEFDRWRYPALHADDDAKAAIKAQIAAELVERIDDR